MLSRKKLYFYGRDNRRVHKSGPPQFKTQVYQCLEEAHGKCQGSFAHGETLPSAPNPGLAVHGLGTIALPLFEREARRLKQACHQAPFGRGSETLVDTKVRDTWELNADQFVLRNHSWQVTLANTLRHVAQALGVAGGSTAIRAELYKLLLYDQGAFFDSHTDTEKVPGMIGTLVIALPSKHTGGDVETSFKGKTLTLNTSESSDYGYSYVAWYSDVEHAVRPVISGHRLVLTYNLIQVAGGQRQAASSLKDEQATLVRTLALWGGLSSQDPQSCPKFLAYMLDHKYTDANLRSDHLKGKDAQQFRALQAACQALDIDLLLANVEYTKGGSCEQRYDPSDRYGGRRRCNWKTYEDDDDISAESDEGSGYGSKIHKYHELAEVYDNSLSLRTFCRANGQLLARDIDIEGENIMQDDAFDRTPDKEDYEGYTGNAGASATHIYRNSCIVLMPRSNIVSFLLEHASIGFVSLDGWLGPMTDEVKDDPTDERPKKELTRICHLFLTAYTNGTDERPGISRYDRSPNSFSDIALGVVARAALHLKDQTLFDKASSACMECLPIEIYSAFGGTLDIADLTQWSSSLLLALGRVSKVHLRWEAVKTTLEARNASQQDSLPLVSDALGNLLRQSIEDILSLEVTTCKLDAQAIIDIIQAYGPGFLFKHVLPFVKKQVTNATFTITFLILLFEAEKLGTFKAGLSKNIYRDVLADLVPMFKVGSDLHSQKRPKYVHHYMGGRTSEQNDVDFIDPIEVADLLDHCKTLSLADELEGLVDQLVVASKLANPSAFAKLFIPLLKRMVVLSHSANLPITDTIPRHFTKSIIDEFVLRYVEPEPEKPRDWAQARTGCHNGCGDCSRLNTFLVNPQERTGRFAIAEKRRRHLTNQLSYSGCTLDTEHRGIPYTLVVTKTEKKWHEHHKAWRKRCRVAEQSFEDIGVEALQEILGEDYERAVDCKSKKVGSAADREAGPAVETPARSFIRPTLVSTMNQPIPFPTAILAKAHQQAARKTPLRALTQPHAPPTNAVPGQPKEGVSKVQIIDLTME